MEYIIKFVWIYLVIILLIVVCDVYYFIHEKMIARKRLKIAKKYREMVTEEIKNLKKSALASSLHLSFLETEMKMVENLLIFEDVLHEFAQKDPQKFQAYCKSISAAFQNLAIYYRKKNSLQKAYFTHLLSLFPELIQEDREDAIHYAMMHFILDESVYCRENAMLFFLMKKKEQLVVNSLKKISSRGFYYHPKLLADDLLKFNGDASKLAILLLQDFDKFHTSFQVAIVNYIRFLEKDVREGMYQLFQNKKYHKEVRLAMMRYFAKYPYPSFLEDVLELIKDKRESHFEYRLVGAFALASYDVKKARAALIECLTDRNFHVRKNAALSLVRMHLTKEDLKVISELTDPYAIDMLKYVWQQAGKSRTELELLLEQKGERQNV